MSKKRFMPMQARLFILLIIALLIAAAVFGVVREIGNFMVWRYYLNETSKQERADRYVERFQEYVVENKLAVDDSHKIADFDAGRYVDLIIYKDSSLVYAPEWFQDYYLSDNDEDTEDATSLETETEEATEYASEHDTELSTVFVEAPDYYESWFSGDRGFESYLTEEARDRYVTALASALEGNHSLHPVYFLDGTLLVTVVDYSEEIVYNLVFAISIMLSFAVISVIMIFYISRMASRIKKLANSVRQVKSGDLEKLISAPGNDEITELADDVNSMRNAIVENMTKERQAWEANVGLITAMSHDVRTPLTVILGYLDLIEMQGADGNAEYVAACKDNAMRLKELSDDLFSYFLVFGKSEERLNMVSRDASEWLSYVISEHALLLNERGYDFVYEGDITPVNISLDERYFSRVIDNIFSNILKYADSSDPVRISLKLCGEDLILSFENRIKKNDSMAQSNKIGLKTCVKIMEKMGGKLLYSKDNETFTVSVILCTEGECDNGADS